MTAWSLEPRAPLSGWRSPSSQRSTRRSRPRFDGTASSGPSGPSPRVNRVVELTPVEVHVETERSRSRGGAEPIPAWMFNLAWDRLRTFKTLTNSELLNDLRVHRSSAVCAILARLPQVERVPGREILLRWR